MVIKHVFLVPEEGFTDSSSKYTVRAYSLKVVMIYSLRNELRHSNTVSLDNNSSAAEMSTGFTLFLSVNFIYKDTVLDYFLVNTVSVALLSVISLLWKQDNKVQ